MWKGYNTNKKTFEEKLEGEEECMYLGEEPLGQRGSQCIGFAEGAHLAYLKTPRLVWLELSEQERAQSEMRPGR